MPFLTAPFILRMQESFDKDAPNFGTHTEGEFSESQLGEKNPMPPLKWATAWSQATAQGAKGITSIPIYPPVTCQLINVAEIAMKGVLLGNNPYTPPFSILKSAFVTFASTMCPGWMPTYIGVPPGGPPNFESLSAYGFATKVNTPWIVQCANMLSQWFMTGTLIPTPAGITSVNAIPSNWL